MKVTITNNKNGNVKEYELNEDQIRLTRRGGVGVSIGNIFKLGKNEEITSIEC